MINWLVLGKDNLRRDTSDTGVPFVRPAAKRMAQALLTLSLADHA